MGIESRELDLAVRELRFSRAELATCKRERTIQAQYAVRLEDELNELREERELLIKAVQHLHHTHQSDPHGSLCTHSIHEKVKEYV